MKFLHIYLKLYNIYFFFYSLSSLFIQFKALKGLTVPHNSAGVAMVTVPQSDGYISENAWEVPEFCRDYSRSKVFARKGFTFTLIRKWGGKEEK